MAQKFILAKQMEKLRENGRKSDRTGDGSNFYPVVKFFTPDANATWLISEIAPDGDIMFGLCDLGHGTPELGYVSLAELQSVRGPLGLKVERDIHFEASGTMKQYADAARREGRIVEKLG
ncbi:DUF2958 domain-containing protein [Erythrobacter phage vB_EliS-L02]|nr:DUF2958 domain-containing protein [Erythrobacter phage vB_EliS-L02]